VYGMATSTESNLSTVYGIITSTGIKLKHSVWHNYKHGNQT